MNQTQQSPCNEVSYVSLMGLSFAELTEASTNQLVIDSLRNRQGGWICPVNLDVLRQFVDHDEIRRLVSTADLVIADGMPLIWASRLKGTPLPERVSGSSLITTLSAELNRSRHSMYLLGGNEGAADEAGLKLREMYPGLQIAGSHCPPFGFERDPAKIESIENLLQSARPDVVFVGLGFPKQDLLIAQLRSKLPHTWFVSCGISFSFVAGEVRRAPPLAQKLGLEWLHRLAQEPRRLAQRYLVQGPPFAARLLITSFFQRLQATKKMDQIVELIAKRSGVR
jgi:N-acetylglucosaminyldiphosphoundecaprenol N-acetyl-beta-D-mannosaminyltransferase